MPISTDYFQASQWTIRSRLASVGTLLLRLRLPERFTVGGMDEETLSILGGLLLLAALHFSRRKMRAPVPCIRGLHCAHA